VRDPLEYEDGLHAGRAEMRAEVERLTKERDEALRRLEVSRQTIGDANLERLETAKAFDACIKERDEARAAMAEFRAEMTGVIVDAWLDGDRHARAEIAAQFSDEDVAAIEYLIRWSNLQSITDRPVFERFISIVRPVKP